MQRLAALVPRPRLAPDRLSWGAGASRQTAGCNCPDSCARRQQPGRQTGECEQVRCPSVTHELGAVVEASVRYRYRTLPASRGANLKIIAVIEAPDVIERHASGAIRPAAATGSGAAGGTFSGGLMLERGLVLAGLAGWLGLGSGYGVNALKNKMLAVARWVSLSGKRWGGRKITGG